MVFVGSRKTTPYQQDRYMAKLGAWSANKVLRVLAKPAQVTPAQLRDVVAYTLLDRGLRVGGVAARSGKNARVYVARKIPPGFSRREVVRHELFHAKVPILWKSEVLAHLYGGLRSKRRGVSPMGALRSLKTLAVSRPDRLAAEVGLAYGGYAAVRNRNRRRAERSRLQHRR